MKNLNQTQYRQGDVFLQKIDALPAGCTEEPQENNRAVLAHGEVTGHAHAVYDVSISGVKKALAKIFRDVIGNRYLHVIESAPLNHEEHSAPTLPAGFYRLPTQVEYSPEALRKVQD